MHHASQYLKANLFDRLDQLSGALPGRHDLAVPIIDEVPMFRIHAPILIVPTAEALPTNSLCVVGRVAAKTKVNDDPTAEWTCRFMERRAASH